MSYTSKLFLTEDEYNKLQEHVTMLDTDVSRRAYREGRFARADKVKDLDMRYRWDLYWAAGLPRAWSNAIYDRGGHDSHIDSALKRIVKPLTEG